jgi:hypothetical protein
LQRGAKQSRKEKETEEMKNIVLKSQGGAVKGRRRGEGRKADQTQQRAKSSFFLGVAWR